MTTVPHPCRHEHPDAKRTRELNPGQHVRIVDCDLWAGHDGDHEETDTGNTWPQEGKPADAAYGELVLTRKMPAVVGSPPERTLMTVELLRSLNSAHLVGPDRICVGEDADGEPVFYRITGWNAAFSALVLTRCDR